MNEEQEWEQLSRRLFNRPEVKAPPYLWTRILAAIEAREEQLSAWWRQWRWMGRLASAMALLVFIAAGAVIYEESQSVPLDNLLEGTSSSAPITLAAYNSTDTSEAITTAWLVEGGSSWEEN